MLTLAMAAGCQAAGPQGLVKVSTAGTSGLLANAGAGIVSNNGAGLVAPNAGRLSGVVRGPGAGLLSNNSAGLVANNGAGLLANNGAGLISNNAGSLISNNAGTFRVLQAAGAFSPIAHAAVTARDAFGEPLGPAVRADAEGRYTLAGLRPSGPVVFVTASYTGGGVEAVLSTVADAPRDGDVPAELDPATTLLAKKLAEASRDGSVGLTPAAPGMVAEARGALAAAMSETAAVASAIADDNLAARVFDAMLGASPALRREVSGALVTADLAGVLVKTPARSAAPAASPRPAAPSAPLATPPALLLFDEAFAEGWGTDGTWNGTAEPGSEVTPFSGASAVAWRSGARGGFKFTGATGVDTTGYKHLTFALRAGRATTGLRLQALDGSRAIGHPLDLADYGEAIEGAWKRYDVPLTDLAAGERVISGFMLTEALGEDLPATYLDRVGLER